MSDLNGNGRNGITAWKTAVTILATLCVALFLQVVSNGYSTPKRDEVDAKITEVKRESNKAIDNMSQKLDQLQRKIDELSLRVEHVDTLLQDRKDHR